ncbi:hypothetical protein GGR50DRAFT_681341 [Xylaria sp. CBS 124048]|nr:hypothetical protein GGR50DRAFT_681341 [Xylaria sp. CBS 124048]
MIRDLGADREESGALQYVNCLVHLSLSLSLIFHLSSLFCSSLSLSPALSCFFFFFFFFLDKTYT